MYRMFYKMVNIIFICLKSFQSSILLKIYIYIYITLFIKNKFIFLISKNIILKNYLYFIYFKYYFAK